MSEQHLEQIVETLSQLTVIDLSKLKTRLEDKWGVKAAAAAVAVAAPAAAGAAPAASESTEFEVTLAEAPADKKIGIIKVVREATNLGLKEAKEMVDAAPKVVKEKASKAEADELVKKLEAAGAKAKVRGL
jgi:large subunit ribosomal protein L7/L12